MNRAINKQAGTTQPHEGCGYLPACAPLANPYVPFQRNEPERYEAPKALIRGTLFPGLDLPFMGRVNKQELASTPMHELQALGFVINELVLYLDTHQDDEEAAQMLQSYSKLYQQGVEKVHGGHGPMNHLDAVRNEKFQWLEGVWPWEFAENKEG